MSAPRVYDLLRSASRGLIGIDQRFMHALVDDPAKSVPDLLKFASEDHSDDPVDLEPDVIAAFRYLKIPEALPFYIEALRRAGNDADEDLLNAVIELGPAALDPLLRLYEEMDEADSGDVAFALAGLGVRDDRILRVLFDRLQYDAADGAMSLALYGDAAAIPEIRKLLDSIPGNEAGLRRDLTEAIDDIERGAVNHSTGHEFRLFERYPEEAGPDFDALSEEDRRSLLASDAPKLRAEAARSFFQSAYAPETRVRLFAVARTDAEPGVRARAWEALSGDEDPDIRKALREVALGSTAPVEERAGAIVALASESVDDPEVRAAVEALYHEPRARAKALEAMWRSFDRSFSSYFPAHLEDPDRAILVQAIFGTGYLGIGSEAERIARYFTDDDLRPDALFAYALAVPAEISRGRIQGVFRKIERAAGGLNVGEADLVQVALDQRLLLHGLEPVFFPESEAGEEAEHVHGPECGHDSEAAPALSAKVGRNDPCPCGSGKKYKRCHGT